MHRATVGGRSSPTASARPTRTGRGSAACSARAGSSPARASWIKPSNQVHMFGMRYAIDVVFLDDAGRVLRVVHALQPNRISPRVKGATSVLELPAGTARARRHSSRVHR